MLQEIEEGLECLKNPSERSPSRLDGLDDRKDRADGGHDQGHQLFNQEGDENAGDGRLEPFPCHAGDLGDRDAASLQQVPDRLANANDLVDLVLKPALHRGLDLDPQVVLNSILDGCGQVRNPAARIGRDVLHQHREGPERCQGAAGEIERAMDRCPHSIECGLHALVQ